LLMVMFRCLAWEQQQICHCDVTMTWQSLYTLFVVDMQSIDGRNWLMKDGATALGFISFFNQSIFTRTHVFRFFFIYPCVPPPKPV
jgi:hypothetical protein